MKPIGPKGPPTAIVIFFETVLTQILQEASKHAAIVNWKNVEHLNQFSGIRIQDEVHCTEAAAENLTRDAFAEIKNP